LPEYIDENKTELCLYTTRQRVGLVAGPLLALTVGVAMMANEHGSAVCWTAAIATLASVWWICESLPVAATALIPLAVFPLAGVLNAEQVAMAYGSDLILLMLGGFLLSAAMEKSQAHRRIALRMVYLFGSENGRRLVFGFMAASAMLSMWISNAATVLMLLPIVQAVIQQTKSAELRCSLLLGIAYAASIGGIGTPIGTPPNLIFMQVYRQHAGKELSFINWTIWALPVVVLMLPLSAWWLTRHVRAIEPIRLPAVGICKPMERRTLAVFAIVAFLWVTRTQPFGGWSSWLNIPYANDAAIALLGAVALFMIPSGTPGRRLLDWPTAAKIPWGVLLLFAGGICIATAFSQSGLSEIVGKQVGRLAEWHPLLIVGTICLFVTFLTEVTSNTATANILLPVMAAAAMSADADLRLFMFPAAVSCSFAFMFPVATPPNAIVFGSDELTVSRMAREGLVLNMMGVVVASAVSYWLFGPR
jgi:sodium-dependent dicarboxylate transporter 2/3/5